MKILTAYNDTDNKVEETAKRSFSPSHYHQFLIENESHKEENISFRCQI